MNSVIGGPVPPMIEDAAEARTAAVSTSVTAHGAIIFSQYRATAEWVGESRYALSFRTNPSLFTRAAQPLSFSANRTADRPPAATQRPADNGG